MNYLPTCTSKLVVQDPCQVSFKSMQVCRRSWEGKLKCVKNLSVKDHYSAKICWTWIISQHALLDLWYNICTNFHLNPCKGVGGVEKTNFDVTEWRKDGQNKELIPLAILWLGHKKGIMLKFFESRSNVMIKVLWSKLMLPPERSWCKEHTRQIWNSSVVWLGSFV